MKAGKALSKIHIGFYAFDIFFMNDKKHAFFCGYDISFLRCVNEPFEFREIVYCFEKLP